MEGTEIERREFSRRERQIIDAVCDAKAVKDIARDLDLSVNTVKDYLKTVYRKAEVHSARELMLKLKPGLAGDQADGLAQLLQVAQSLGQEAMPQAAVIQLGSAVRRCTRAQRVCFWRLVQGSNGVLLANDSGLGTLQLGGFLRRVLDHGWARLEAEERRGPEGRQLGLAGLSGEVLGVRCSPAPRVQVMLCGNPSGGSFAALDLPIARLLARLAQSSAGERRLAMTA